MPICSGNGNADTAVRSGGTEGSQTCRSREMDSNFRFRDKASAPRFRFRPASLMSTYGSCRELSDGLHAAVAGDYRRRPPLHGTRNRKFESISLQQLVCLSCEP